MPSALEEINQDIREISQDPKCEFLVHRGGLNDTDDHQMADGSLMHQIKEDLEAARRLDLARQPQ